MKIGIRDACRHCAEPIAICPVRGGKWLPFDLAMVAYLPEAPDAYLPVRQGTVVALVPVGELSDTRLRGVAWIAQRHRCAAYMRAKTAELLARQEAHQARLAEETS
jgi:hypothetical protein